MNNELHLDEHTESRLNILEYELRKKIQGLQRSLLSQGQTGGYCQSLSDLLIVYIENSAKEIKIDIFNKIKVESVTMIPEFSEIKILIEKRMQIVLDNTVAILAQEVLKACHGIQLQANNITNELAFQSRYKAPLNVLYNQFEAELVEYQQDKKMKEATLQKAQEANDIARSSKKSSWWSLFIALLAFIFSIVTYFKK